MLTIQEVAQAVPANLKSSVTQHLVDTVNNIVADPEVAEQIRNNFVSYTNVLRDGKFKTEDYLNAVVYVSYKLMGLTNQEAYIKTFPQRYQALLAKGTPSRDISSFVAAYNRGKLVNLILEQCMVPSWVLNQDIYQKAINVQADLMLNANSEKVRSDAANSLLTHLKKPENHNFQISMEVNESAGLNELRDSLNKLAEKQLELIESGVSTKLIAASPLIEGEFKEV